MSGLQGHTPGPWKAGKYCVWGGHNGDTYVAGTQTGIDADEQAANARLIASAPDMRAVLAECVRVYDEHRDAQPTGHLWPDPNHIHRARALLAPEVTS